MFEGIDEATINTANNIIKEVYAKITNKTLLSITTKEDILERDFDNAFIFEDFFSDFMTQNKDIDNFKQILIEEIVDTIEANLGEIDIFELYNAIVYEEEIEKETPYISTPDEFYFNKKLPDNFELAYNNKPIMDLSDINEKNISEITKKLGYENKKRQMKIKTSFDSEKDNKSHFNEETIINTKRILPSWKRKKK